jgi:lipopolysaccharide transport system permease protein
MAKITASFSVLRSIDWKEFSTSFKTFNSNRRLIWAFTKRDLTGRYKGSFLGALWSFINPLVLMVIYTIVFAVFLKIRFGNTGSTLHSTLYILAGIIPWIAFQESICHSAMVVSENANLIKKMIFPSEILPIKVALSCLISQSIGFAILVAGQLFINQEFHWTMAQLPLIVFFQFIFTLGISWLVASLGVFVKDINQAINLLLVVIFFMTPIMYPISIFPFPIVRLINLNPMTVIITSYRDLILEGKWIEWFTLAKLMGTSLFIFLLGFFWFTKTKKLFIDIL